MFATLLPASGAPSRFYRRTATTKAPRKRSFLVKVSKRSPMTEAKEAGIGGGDGPKGPGGVPRVCCWGDNNSGGGGDTNGSLSWSGVLVAAAAGTTLSVAAPNAATAADVDGFASFYPTAAAGEAASEHDECFLNSTFLSEDERDLLAPKQYRVREWVYVH